MQCFGFLTARGLDACLCPVMPASMVRGLQAENLTVEFDPELAELLCVGMIVSGTFNLLSDGTWCCTQAPPLITNPMP